jgi:hypothetical protein
MLTAQADVVSCCLCGEIHGIRVHAILVRLVRTEEEGNSEILILAIYCLRAKKQGRQYTKRMLPPFVIPECNITLENVLRYLHCRPEQNIDYDAASAMLGSYDPRTLKRHILLGLRMIQEANVLMAELLVGLSPYARLPQLKGSYAPIESLGILTAELRQTVRKVAGQAIEPPQEGLFIHRVYVHTGCRNPLATALNRVFREVAFCDTS